EEGHEIQGGEGVEDPARDQRSRGRQRLRVLARKIRLEDIGLDVTHDVIHGVSPLSFRDEKRRPAAASIPRVWRPSAGCPPRWDDCPTTQFAMPPGRDSAKRR